MTYVGVRDLKDHLSEYLRRAEEGERIIVTDRGQPLAALTPIEETDEVRWGWALVREGVVRWGGGKPRGSAKASVLKGRKTTSALVLEGRR